LKKVFWTKEKVPVNRFVKFVFLAAVLMLLSAAPALAAEGAAGSAAPALAAEGAAGSAAANPWFFTKYFGVGLTVIGASYGIGKLASSAYEGMSRQPEVAGNIQTAMIIAAALIEGFTFFALLICMLF
jgi:F-type H+-transporting ATPase subunit c